jgi:hypothetical protein
MRNSPGARAGTDAHRRSLPVPAIVYWRHESRARCAASMRVRGAGGAKHGGSSERPAQRAPARSTITYSSC